ncbi:MAG TPA: hypothetical protein VJU77_04860 [Chthoniobacterales bacterium]|nr:hypothetical protein [Chthoniobacterales bacterium]
MPEPEMKHTRGNDRCNAESAAVKPEPAQLAGTWFNTDPGTSEISKVILSVRDGVVAMRAFGANGTAPIDWGEVPATPYVDRIGSSLVTGFLAHYDFGFMQTQLATNVKYGVLVIQSYNRFADESGRPPYFTREFFSKEVAHNPAPLPAEAACATRADLPIQSGTSVGAVDLAHYVGHWTNTNPETLAITHFDFTKRGERFYVRASGSGYPGDWGEAEVTPHAYDVSSPRGLAFIARYVFDFAEITLAGNENKGLIIIASYHRFKDASSRSNYFKREFFYRQEAVRR